MRGHFETILGTLLSKRPTVSYRRERMETPDGDFLDIDWMESGDPSQPLAVIFHGLEGSSAAPYILKLVDYLDKKGIGCAAVNMRMCSGEPNRLSGTYHSGKSEDIDCVVRFVCAKDPGRKLFLAGFSIGGNMMLKWLGEQGENARQWIKKAAAVSVPYDLVRSVERMDRGFNREVYTRLLLRSLTAKAKDKHRLFPDLIRYEKVKRCRTFRVFDREITARLNGFQDETDYWMRSSSRYYLSGIKVPVLLIHAGDDPFFPGSDLPFREIRTNPQLRLILRPTGGHLGFFPEGWPWRQEPWLEETIGNYYHESI